MRTESVTTVTCDRCGKKHTICNKSYSGETIGHYCLIATGPDYTGFKMGDDNCFDLCDGCIAVALAAFQHVACNQEYLHLKMQKEKSCDRAR